MSKIKIRKHNKRVKVYVLRHIYFYNKKSVTGNELSIKKNSVCESILTTMYRARYMDIKPGHYTYMFMANNVKKQIVSEDDTMEEYMNNWYGDNVKMPCKLTTEYTTNTLKVSERYYSTTPFWTEYTANALKVNEQYYSTTPFWFDLTTSREILDIDKSLYMFR